VLSLPACRPEQPASAHGAVREKTSPPREARITGLEQSTTGVHNERTPLGPELLTSYQTNVLRVLDDDYTSVIELRPDPGWQHNDTTFEPTYLLPTWNPAGRPTSVGENVAWRETAEYHALAAAGFFLLGSAHAPDYTWAEEILAVELASDEAAAALARRINQAACWRWDGASLHVIDSSNAERLASTPAGVRRLERQPCPMRPRDQDSLERCERPGGPWTSKSMEAAAFFERDRAALVTALGCSICHGGAVRGVPGQPILLHEWSAASRYADPQILREIDPAG